MVVASRLQVLEPVSEAVIEPGKLTARLGSLDGKVVGLYSNNKLNATKLLDMVGTLLSERFDLESIVRGNYNASRLMRREEWKDIERCDAIILANGD